MPLTAADLFSIIGQKEARLYELDVMFQQLQQENEALKKELAKYESSKQVSHRPEDSGEVRNTETAGREFPALVCPESSGAAPVQLS